MPTPIVKHPKFPHFLILSALGSGLFVVGAIHLVGLEIPFINALTRLPGDVNPGWLLVALGLAADLYSVTLLMQMTKARSPE